MKILFFLSWFFLPIVARAEENLWILWWVKSSTDEQWNTISAEERIRTGDIHVDDLPSIITTATDYIFWFAWTIAVLFIIIWAYQIAIWAITSNTSTWRETIIYALWGLALSGLSWIIINFIISNLS